MAIPAAAIPQPDEQALARRIAIALARRASPAGRARVCAWLAEIAPTVVGADLGRLLAGAPAAAALIDSIAESSPFLWDLASREPARLLGLLNGDPDRDFPALLAGTRAAVAAAADEVEVMHLLRRLKAEAALLIAIADIGGIWPVMRITRALTELADIAVASAVDFLIGRAGRDGKLTVVDASAPVRGSGYVVFAMGKMGAFELNYSSDVDLIVFFDGAAAVLGADVEPTTFFVRLTRGLVKILQERTVDGYVFRVDLRLRPDPASTQIAMSMRAALDYYEGTGQNWERAALIKARPCAGDIAAGAAFLSELSPFIWRKYLDFAAIADVHAMKRQIHAYRGHDEIAVEGHNIKLGRGGIREIEFFVQTQQLIAGGRHPELRGRETLDMLDALARGGWIAADAAEELSAAYCFLRTVEHRLQMVADEQTHTLPSSAQELDGFAKFLGFSGRDEFAEHLLPHLRNVQRHYARLFENAPAVAAERRGLVFPAAADDGETLDKLAAIGFHQPLVASATVRRWLTGTYRPLIGPFARRHLAELVPLLLDHFSRTRDPDHTLVAFDRFLAGLKGGARLILLLHRNPDLVALLALALGTAPRLADILAQYPQVMDSLIDPAFFGALPDDAKLNAELARSLKQARSYEDVLDRVRMFGQEHMFLIGARILSGTVSAEQAGEAFALLADVLICAMHRAVTDAFAAAHGRLPGQESAVLAMGKLGGREMTASSDVDLILVYDFSGELTQSDGARPLYGSQYFARLTQRLISALSAPTNFGALYKVDMRLRPSGRSGPVATPIEGFRHYQDHEAWTWEHLALTRARVVSASAGFTQRVERVIADVLCRRRDAGMVAQDVVEMRAAIAKDKGDGDRWDLKYVAGGLIDLEFLAQYLQLIQAADHPDILDTSTARALDKAWRLGLLAAADADVLRPAARLYHNLTQILRLCLTGPFDPASAGPELLGLLARAADVPDFATLEAHLGETQARVRASFERILGRAG
ncbi:MAG TPA: bifunctional [glutamine synthetase] adenylyltransferase/[glutamine synthetase]-adenylyl-L-tyrosine phosphorylase [Xanthobacteraceae bacterium]|nr:bifunctional [glutamine synthetase] adenylyltransferase/[glutamine synthetase]-adenylyl-L-tyrosine phosphorylase [Xanthobacteraceae bacterium]